MHGDTFSGCGVKRPCGNTGLNDRISQINTSFSEKAGTLRGLHLQSAPAAEVKIVQCLKGSAFETVVDLREDSPTYLRWFGVELNELDQRQLYVPEGCAHGYQALEDGTVVQYSASAPYSPEHEYGIRWDDPAIGMDWPMAPLNVTEKDSSWPLLERG